MRFRRMLWIFLCLMIALGMLMPLTAGAQETPRQVVRVGWYDSSYNTMDAAGRRSGYAYEYQMKLAAYLGWTYEYVNGSWPELLQMLEDGEIDLMTDVSYTPERESRMLFSSLPMGTEDYYIFMRPGNPEIIPSDPSSLNGKTVGVNRDSIQADFFREWARRNDVRTELVELACPEEESLRMLADGELDAYVTVDSFIDPTCASPVTKVGSSDFFFAVSKSRPELLGELNAGMNRIHDENPYYNQQMYEKYIKRSGANVFLQGDELAWLNAHGPIRVGYQDNYLAFCAADKDTGELTGVLKAACRLICRVFQHSPVYRIGCDEFAVILKNNDYLDRDELVRRFEEEADAINASTPNRWEQVHIAMGVAVHDPQTESSAIDTVRRADKIMYANKRMHKNAQASAEPRT